MFVRAKLLQGGTEVNMIISSISHFAPNRDAEKTTNVTMVNGVVHHVSASCLKLRNDIKRTAAVAAPEEA